MVEAVHDADLLPDILFLFCRICFEEFPCPDFSSFLFYQSKDLSKFPTANERGEKAISAKLSTTWGIASYGLWGKSGLFYEVLVGHRHAHGWLLSTAAFLLQCAGESLQQTVWPTKPKTSLI